MGKKKDEMRSNKCDVSKISWYEEHTYKKHLLYGMTREEREIGQMEKQLWKEVASFVAKMNSLNQETNCLVCGDKRLRLSWLKFRRRSCDVTLSCFELIATYEGKIIGLNIWNETKKADSRRIGNIQVQKNQIPDRDDWIRRNNYLQKDGTTISTITAK